MNRANEHTHTPSDPVSQTARGWTERWACLWCWCRWRPYTDERRWQQHLLSGSCCHCGDWRWPSSPHQWTISGTQGMEPGISGVTYSMAPKMKCILVLNRNWLYAPHVHVTECAWKEGIYATWRHPFLKMYHWQSTCLIHLPACQVRVTIADPSLCSVFCVAVLNLSSQRKGSRKPKILNTMWCCCCFYPL